MFYDKIPAHESEFRTTGIAIKGAKFILEAKSITGLDYVKCIPEAETNHYYPEKFDKKSITLHLTEGHLKGDIYYLTHKGHLSVPFLIARDGTIYNLFSSSYWSYHLGRGASGGNTVMSKATVPIELSNIGPLNRDGDFLHTRYGGPYCHINDHNQYHQFEDPYRGYNYFATQTEQQYASLSVLLRYLRDKYDIPLDFLPVETRYSTLSSPDISSFKGVSSHVNFRNDVDQYGKYRKVDIGAGFQWEKLQEMLN